MRFKAKEDCFGFIKEENGMEFCNALTRLYCKVEECPFYKTKKEESMCRKKYGFNLQSYALKHI